MEEQDKGSKDSEVDATLGVEVTDQAVDEPQRPEYHYSQMRDQIVADTDSSNDESGEIQPKADQCKESMPNLPEVSVEPPEMEHGAVSGVCQKPVTSQKADAVAIEASEATTNVLNKGSVIAEDIKYHTPTPGESSKEYLERLEIQEDVADEEMNMEAESIEQSDQLEAESIEQGDQLEAESIEQGRQPQQELQIHLAEQAVELVLEEAVISHVRRERMEEAETIEEPRRYSLRKRSRK